MTDTQRRRLRILLAPVAAALLVAGVWAAVWWARYPSAPDPSRASLDDATAFLGSADFRRLTAAHKKRFAIAVADRTRDIPFKDLMGRMMNGAPSMRAASENLRTLSRADRDEVGAHFFRSFLDGFYAQPGTDRQAYLLMMALAERAARGRAATQPGTQPTSRPAKDQPFGGAAIPSPEQLDKEMTKLLTTQPPKTVAQASQLFLDMRRTKDTLGFK